MTQVLAQEKDIRVSVAADPLIAMDKMKRTRPSVILLDLDMPHMTGLEFLQKIMAEDPIPVVICSALTVPGSSVALAALDHGAVDVITKPTVGVREFLYESSILLVDAVRSAAQARVRRRAAVGFSSGPAQSVGIAAVRPLPVQPRARTGKVIVVGASTGGTEALYEFLRSMPSDAPGIVAVVHMPELFTGAFARRLQSLCQIEVKQAGGRTLAQDEASCVVFGMPREAINRGAVERVCSLQFLAQAVLEVAQNSGAAANVRGPGGM